ncbi:MAG: FGGY-family carbohydrate kinase, partial [Treponema sp.]|nr:FGGY-family carbohydrate kinase [Treponema sp.]
LNTLQWSRPLMELFGIEPDSLPQICFSDSCFGQTSLDGLFKKPIPIHGVLGDSHAALFANRCLEPFSAKATYGTGSSVMMNCGKNRPTPKEGIVTSLAWGMQGSVDYVLEGNINYTGAVIKWLAEEMELISSPKEAAILAASVNDNGGVYLVPAFSGLGAPWFRDSVRAAVIGLNRSSRKAHLVRAAEECIAYQIRDVTEIIKASVSRPFSSLRLDGGPTADQFLMQFQADILGMDLFINNTTELSGAGAAYCAAAGIGIASAETLFKHGSFRAVHPAMDEIQREKLYQGWKKAVASVASSD